MNPQSSTHLSNKSVTTKSAKMPDTEPPMVSPSFCLCILLLIMKSGNKISYLDITLERKHKNKITTVYYQKPTSKGRLLNFNSEHPLIQRTSMAYGTISRILTLTSPNNRNTAIKEIYRLLKVNSYLHKLIKRLIQQFDNKNTKPEQSNINEAETTPKLTYKGLTYTTHLSE